MKWEDFRRSDNVEDAAPGGGGGGMPFGGGFRLGGGAIIAVIVISLLLGKNPLEMLSLLEGGAPPPTQSSVQAPPGAPAQNDPNRDFVRAILGDTEDFWTAEFARYGKRYEQPKLELFHGRVGSACGLASAAMGPFYCPGDRKVYLDLDFFRELSQRFGAPGDFARAYVIAHEVGHHVQQQLGIADKVSSMQRRASDRDANQLSVRLELQADCYAGVWGNRGARTGLVEPGDAEAGLRAAAAIGDDRLQRMSSGRVQPESFTHGSSEQRVEWLKRGLESGDPGACNTFQGVF